MSKAKSARFLPYFPSPESRTVVVHDFIVILHERKLPAALCFSAAATNRSLRRRMQSKIPHWDWFEFGGHTVWHIEKGRKTLSNEKFGLHSMGAKVLYGSTAFKQHVFTCSRKIQLNMTSVDTCMDRTPYLVPNSKINSAYLQQQKAMDRDS